jgi:N-acetylglucosamine-6-sulfatase
MRRVPFVTVAVGVTALLAAACGVPDSQQRGEETGDAASVPSTAATIVHQTRSHTSGRPNIVFVLLDDFSMDLLPTMRSARVMARRGASYENSFVVDSLCCVSRSATFTGQYPHQTGVLTNNSNLPNRHGPLGGWRGFATYGNQARTFAVGLQESGYVTGFVGKYLNGYEVRARDQQLPPAPPGWSDFRAIFGTAYDGWDFQGTRTTDKGTTVVRSWPAPPAGATRKEKDRAYAGTVIGGLAMKFLSERRGDPRPYFLEVAPYAPHGRVDDDPAYADESLFPAAYRDQPGGAKKRGDCGLVGCRGLTTRDLPGFHDPGSAQGNRRPHTLTRSQAQTNLRDRARMAQSVDRMVLRILRQVDDNTYVVLTSDNGFHLGQMGLLRGKGTAYDTDTRVPLLVVGPRVTPGSRDTMVSNIDLAPTFEELAGVATPPYRSGRSLVPTLADPAAPVSDYVFFEHTFSMSRPGDDPDRAFTGGGLNVIPSYVAVRSRTALLVRNDVDRRWGRHRYAYELYDYGEHAWERTNRYADPDHAAVLATLMAKLDEWDACSRLRRGHAVPDSCRSLTVASPLG